ncbi:MAG: helix-turn-helix transcriptional regulator [Polyangiaceae bacterium]
MTTDLVSIIESAYRVEQSEGAWLEDVLRTAAPLLDQGMGCSAFFYDASDVHRLRLHGFRSEGAHDDGMIMRAIERSAPDRVRWVFRTQACRTASEGPDWASQPAAKLFRSWGIADILFVNGLDPSGVGCFVTAKLGDGGTIPAATKLRWSRIATHLAAGYRLVRRLTALPDPPMAVLTPSGHVEHAEGDAKEAPARASLRAAVARIEEARGAQRAREPDRAIASWRGLVSARWSLVDQFEEGGRRYVVARENSPRASGPRDLTVRERQAVGYASLGHSNKLIAYELGVSASTVGVLLFRAAAKVGAKSRAELIAAFQRTADERAS